MIASYESDPIVNCPAGTNIWFIPSIADCFLEPMPWVGLGLGSTWVGVGTGGWVAIMVGMAWVGEGSWFWVSRGGIDFCGTPGASFAGELMLHAMMLAIIASMIRDPARLRFMGSSRCQ
jgi:hypothetical protein